MTLDRARDAAGLGLRPARPGDVAAIAAVERASFADPWSEDAFVELLANERVRVIVAEASGAPDERAPRGERALDHAPALLGYVIAWCVVDEAEIANIAVAPEARGRGIGSTLLDAAIRDALARGATTMFLEVRDSNAAARALYASRGFTEIGRRRRYYRMPVEDALVLRCDIARNGSPTMD